MIKQIADTLEARELFKVSVLQNCEFDRREVAEELAKRCTCGNRSSNWKYNCFIQRIKRKQAN